VGASSGSCWLASGPAPTSNKRRDALLILGLILLLIGIFASIPILTTIGIVLLVVGAVLSVLGVTGRAVGGRNVRYRPARDGRGRSRTARRSDEPPAASCGRGLVFVRA